MYITIYIRPEGIDFCTPGETPTTNPLVDVHDALVWYGPSVARALPSVSSFEKIIKINQQPNVTSTMTPAHQTPDRMKSKIQNIQIILPNLHRSQTQVARDR
jgi:hypothetical protein